MKELQSLLSIGETFSPTGLDTGAQGSSTFVVLGIKVWAWGRINNRVRSRVRTGIRRISVRVRVSVRVLEFGFGLGLVIRVRVECNYITRGVNTIRVRARVCIGPLVNVLGFY